MATQIKFQQLNDVTGVLSLTSAEVSQLANIDSATVSTAQWGYVGGMNQTVDTTATPTFGSVTTAAVKAASAAGLQLQDDSGVVSLFVEDATRSVGIGTASPQCKLHAKTNTVTNGHFSTLLGAAIESNEGRLQLLGKDDGASSSMLALTVAPPTGDNSHWLMHHLPATYDLQFRYRTSTGTAQDLFTSSTLKATLDISGNFDLPSGYLHAAGEVLTNQAEEADLDNNYVLETDMASWYGLMIVRESVDQVTAIYRVDYQTLTAISVDASFTTTKDNAATYNVYWETDQFKVQNKVGDNKNVRVGFVGTN